MRHLCSALYNLPPTYIFPAFFLRLAKTAKKIILTRHRTCDNIFKSIFIWRKNYSKDSEICGNWYFLPLVWFKCHFLSLVGIFLLSVPYHFYSSRFNFGAPVIPRQSKQVKQVLKNSAFAGPGLVSSIKMMCIFLSNFWCLWSWENIF